jgi:hypothetical protein
MDLKGDIMDYNIRYYTGVGGRDAPVLYLVVLALFAREMKKRYILRSGEASGCDYAFSYGSDGEGELYLPWKGFRKSSSSYFLDNMNPDLVSQAVELLQEEDMAPWLFTKVAKVINGEQVLDFKVSEPVRKLHTRNVFQVLGANLNVDDKSSVLVCYTRDGAISHADCTSNTGGTATAIKVADRYQVPIYNIQRQEHFDHIMRIVSKNNQFYNDARNIMWDWMKINSKITNEKEKNMLDFTIEDAKSALNVLSRYIQPIQAH